MIFLPTLWVLSLRFVLGSSFFRPKGLLGEEHRPRPLLTARPLPLDISPCSELDSISSLSARVLTLCLVLAPSFILLDEERRPRPLSTARPLPLDISLSISSSSVIMSKIIFFISKNMQIFILWYLYIYYFLYKPRKFFIVHFEQLLDRVFHVILQQHDFH